MNIHYSPKFKRAHYGNLVQCASVYIDPVCSSKITERRRVELEEGLGRSPWPGVMITLTLQHSLEDNPLNLIHDLNKGIRILRSGWWWKDFKRRIGIVGSITSTESTFGLIAGHHPHKHILELVDGQPDTEQIRAEVSKRYIEIMQELGRYVHRMLGFRYGQQIGELLTMLQSGGQPLRLQRLQTRRAGKGITARLNYCLCTQMARSGPGKHFKNMRQL